jgi:hypothetical protein
MPCKQSPQSSRDTTEILPSESGSYLVFTINNNGIVISIQYTNGIFLNGFADEKQNMYIKCRQKQQKQQEAQRQLESTRETRLAARNNQNQIPSQVYQTLTLLQRSYTGDTIDTIGTFPYNTDFNPQSVDYSNVFDSNFENTSRLNSNLSLNSEFDLLSRRGSEPLDVNGLERYANSMQTP